MKFCIIEAKNKVTMIIKTSGKNLVKIGVKREK